MQTIATYLLRTPELPADEISQRRSKLESLFESWLSQKGADVPLVNEGFFKSKTQQDDTGLYRIDRHASEEGAVTEYTLEEKTRVGLNCTTRISILTATSQVTLYATLTVSNPDDIVAQTFTDAKCPKIIRDAINLFDDWRYFNNKLATSVTPVTGKEEVQALATRLRDGDLRKLPMVVVSEVDGEEIWPEIASQIAYDLSGSAEVYRLNEDASSELTNAVGKINSCYLGAIRIYWPIRTSEGFPRSTVWTAPQLLPEDESMDQEYASRFRSQLRNRVLAAMSISVQEPREIASIKEAEIKGRIAKLEAHAADHETALALIDELQKKNELLKEQLDETNKRYTSLEYQIRYANDGSVASPRVTPASNDEINPPEPGEVRFYKKINEAGDHDKFRIVNDCNHNRWQGSKPADKARKGIIRHEGRDDWKSMQHCAKCTGPGMWRVQW
ncbi:hypothetical protein L2Y90_19380 [Burkholderia pyrrocinia]|uniref:hypothetical protein n=1 Tax=Burkholderia pyrrocinia TaxID=60550 RepID=UPI00215AA9F9|nr:hypothetical protein [Burkholderia pyrrocinia]UVE68928.1 hypothetical protein L2Y90_19380 [Burkholderia pyrrocinia]